MSLNSCNIVKTNDVQSRNFSFSPAKPKFDSTVTENLFHKIAFKCTPFTFNHFINWFLISLTILKIHYGRYFARCQKKASPDVVDSTDNN